MGARSIELFVYGDQGFRQDCSERSKLLQVSVIM